MAASQEPRVLPLPARKPSPLRAPRLHVPAHGRSLSHSAVCPWHPASCLSQRSKSVTAPPSPHPQPLRRGFRSLGSRESSDTAAGVWPGHHGARRPAGCWCRAAARSPGCPSLLHPCRAALSPSAFLPWPVRRVMTMVASGGWEVPRREPQRWPLLADRGRRGCCPWAHHPPSLVPPAPPTPTQDPPSLAPAHFSLALHLGLLPVPQCLGDVVLTLFPGREHGEKHHGLREARHQAHHSGRRSDRPGGSPKVDTWSPMGV